MIDRQHKARGIQSNIRYALFYIREAKNPANRTGELNDLRWAEEEIRAIIDKLLLIL